MKLALSFALLGWLLPNPTAGATADCESLTGLKVEDTTVTSATLVPATTELPKYCKVEGFVTTPNPNPVNFRLGLPDNWNGKFFQAGTGGTSGTIGSIDRGLARGYASTSTDTGHTGSSASAAWAHNNREAEIDFGYRSYHVVTVATKQITEAYYRNPAKYAYFAGCSGGGRQALIQAQRWPLDFDGVIAGAPGLNYTESWMGGVTMQRAVESTPELGAKLRLIDATTLAKCDGEDGLVDGLVSDPYRCEFNPEELVCTGSNSARCLTPAEVETVKIVYRGAVNSTGDSIYPGMPKGHELGWQRWIVSIPSAARSSALPSNLTLGFLAEGPKYLIFEHDDPERDWHDIDVDRDLPRLSFMGRILNATDPDLSEFRERGGKAIMYSGWADPAVWAESVTDYYEEVVKATGGKASTDAFFRLFMAPGMYHCRGGPGPNFFDTLTALEDWVERGIAPDRIIASHRTADGTVDRTRPLCPYPEVAVYNGAGSIDDARYFHCERRRDER